MDALFGGLTRHAAVTLFDANLGLPKLPRACLSREFVFISRWCSQQGMVGSSGDLRLLLSLEPLVDAFMSTPSSPKVSS